MTRQTRRERRQAELDERREQRRRRRPARREERSLLLPLSLGAVALGVVAVIVFAVVSAPPAGVELEEPITQSPYAVADGRELGSADAPLTIDVWSDFQCPACGILARELEPQVVEDYVETGRVRLAYRDFAFLGQESVDAAIAARCAEQQDRFWHYHDYLFANQSGENRGAFSRPRLDAMAEAVGLDMDAYRACRDDPAVGRAVLDERDEARAIPITSTPTLMVGDRAFAGVPQYAELQAAIEQALAETGAAE